jgi:hypothetical protein
MERWIMKNGKWLLAIAVVVLASAIVANTASARLEDEWWETPKLPAGTMVTIDGDPSEWVDFAYTDGVWDWDRITQQAWYTPDVSSSPPGATGPHEGAEAGTSDDFSWEHFSAWDDTGIYVAFMVTDNIWDNHSIGPDSPSYNNSDVYGMGVDTKGGVGSYTEEGYVSFQWRAGGGSTDGQGPEDTKRSIDKLGGDSMQHHNDYDWAIGRSIIHDDGVHAEALGGSWQGEAWIGWEGIRHSGADPSYTPGNIVGKEPGFVFGLKDADGARGDGSFTVHSGEPTSYPDAWSWTRFVDEETAVETSSWGQIKQLFK